MNPQQFTNMAGMGNGMPNNMQQMNPNAFINSQIANQMRQQQPGMPMQGQGGIQVNTSNAQIQRQIYQSLTQQGQFTTGWQAKCTIPERGAQIRQIVDSLRLVRPPVEPPRATEVAIQFERKAFAQSTTKDQYIAECNEKLNRIREQRVQQLSATNMAGMQPQMPMQNQNFMQQMGQTMAMNPAQQMQQQPMFNQAQQNLTQTQMMQPQANPQQNGGQKQPDTLSQQDNHIINQRAAELAKSTPKDKMRGIVDGMNPQLRANLEAKNVDPIIYYFRMMATREFRQQKEKNAQNMMAQTPQQRNMQQPQQPGQMMNMDRFQSQQNEAMRLQQEGDLVVPASSNQGISPEQLRLQQQMMANSQRMNQQTPNQAINDRQRQMQLQASKMQQVNQFRQQNQQEQAMQPNQTPQQANTGLNMLNRPVGPNLQDPSPQNSRPQSRMPQQQMQGQMPMQDQQKREAALARFPVQLQNILRQKPTNEWQAIIQQYQARMKMAQQQQQQQQQNQAQGQQFMPGPMPMQQSLSNGGMPQTDGHVGMQNMQPTQAQMNQQMMRQRALQQQQQMAQAGQQPPQHKPQPPQGQMAPIRPLQTNEVQYMDNVGVPPQVLNSIRQHSRNPLPQIPGGISWLSLKQWLQQNPMQNINMGNIMKWQAQTFFQMQRERQKNAAAADSTVAQMPGPQQQQQPSQQMPNPNQNMPPMRQFTPAELMQARQQFPQLQNVPDETVQKALQARHRNQQQQQQMAMMQANRQGMEPGQQAPQAQQGQRASAQQAPAQQPSQNQQQQQQQPRPQSQTQDRPQPQQNVPTTQAPEAANKAPQSQQPQAPKAQLTQEQYDKLPQVQKQAWIRHQQRQAIVKKIMAITTQVQANLVNPTAPNLDDAARTKLTQKLGGDNVKQMLGRIDSFLLAYFEMAQDEQELKKLIKYRTLLFRQYQQKSVQDKTFVPTTNFSLTPEQVDEMLAELSAKFQQTAAAIPRQPAPGHQLTPENLKQLEAQEQERKKSVSKGKDGPPAAPTSAQPPFSFGGERGHGAPKYAAPGLKVEDLKLPPDPKRRKKNAPATPSTTAPTPVAPTQTPQQQKADLPTPTPGFKCVINNCDRQARGFTTQAELDQHMATVHSMEEVTDPIAFLDEALQQAFNLDENLKQIKKPKAQMMQRAGSNLRHESRPDTPSMARLPSQGGASTIQQEEEDPWQHSNISPEQIEQIFGDMEWENILPMADPSLERRCLDAYMKTDEWLSIFNPPETPESASAKTTTPPTNKDAEPSQKGPEDDFDLSWMNIDGVDAAYYQNMLKEDMERRKKARNADDDSPSEKSTDEFTIPESEAEFLRQNGIDPTIPRDQLSEPHRRMYDFVVEPMKKDIRRKKLDEEWVELTEDDIAKAMKKAEEEWELNKVGKGTPGAWNGHGWNSLSTIPRR